MQDNAEKKFGLFKRIILQVKFPKGIYFNCP